MLLYCTQPLLPLFAQTFHVGPAASSLALSLTTGALAAMILVAGSLAESVGHNAVMIVSLFASAVLTLAAAFTTTFFQLLVLRLLAGAALSGLPSSIMAYLGDEVAPRSIGYAIGLSIGGNAFGGLVGRVGAAAVADYFGWRPAIFIVGAIGLVSAILFWRALPPPRHFSPRPLHPAALLASLGRHFQEPGLRWLFLVPLLLMGSFVSLYNYIGFRLGAPPFNWSQTAIGALFVVYLPGMTASTWAGRLADRYGRRKMLWIAVAVGLAGVLLTLPASPVLVVLGVTTVTMSFFAAHAIASSWVTRRARTARAQAASLYLFSYYLGSSVIGTYGGVVYAEHGWAGTVVLMAGLHLAALGVALRLSFLKPLTEPAA